MSAFGASAPAPPASRSATSMRIATPASGRRATAVTNHRIWSRTIRSPRRYRVITPATPRTRLASTPRGIASTNGWRIDGPPVDAERVHVARAAHELSGSERHANRPTPSRTRARAAGSAPAWAGKIAGREEEGDPADDERDARPREQEHGPAEDLVGHGVDEWLEQVDRGPARRGDRVHRPGEHHESARSRGPAVAIR